MSICAAFVPSSDSKKRASRFRLPFKGRKSCSLIISTLVDNLLLMASAFTYNDNFLPNSSIFSNCATARSVSLGVEILTFALTN